MAARRVHMKHKVVINMIKEVKKCPWLWHVDDPHYNNRSKIARAWLYISEKLDIPEDVLRAKWKNLRDQLRKEFKRYNLKLGHKYTGTWHHFNRLKFLHKIGKCETSEDEENELPDTTEGNVYADELDDNAYEESFFPETEYFELKDPEPRPKINHQLTPEDFDMMFLKSLTPYLQELEPLRKLKVRTRIQNLIFKEISSKTNNDIKL